MRVAFFGGTFDPIHRGHLAIASAAADSFSLDLVLFAPVGRQPLKAKCAVASFADRLAMVEAALRAEPIDKRFDVSTLDAPRSDGTPNYTIDTLSTLADENPGASLFVLTGADSFLTMRKWRASDTLLAIADWIVVSRPEFPVDQERLSPLALTPQQQARIHVLAGIHEEVSATELRRRLKAGDPCAGLLPAPVADFIQTHHLYL